MPHIKAFNGLRYNSKKVRDLARVVAPPYDIIPQKMQDDLYHAHPHNIIRLILNKIEETDDAVHNRYTRAAKHFESWIKDGVLSRDKRPTVYIYTQIYKDGARKVERMGFIALMALDMEGKTILPHENTLAAPKADRLELMRRVKANLSPIFVLYDDKPHKVLKILKRFSSANTPVEDVVFEGVRHKVWAMQDARAIREIEHAMATKNIFIADGHHRYEVARMYARETGASKFMMAFFCETAEKMLTILPTHRVIKKIGTLTHEEIMNRPKGAFFVEKAAGLKSLLARMAVSAKPHTFGAYYGGRYYFLRLKKSRKELDVSILHALIFHETLGIDDSDENIDYVKDPADAVRLVDSGSHALAFFLCPTKVSDVKQVATRGERMPKKATYFYPKPLSGLVINKLD